MSSPWKRRAVGARRRTGATLSEAMIGVVVAAAVFVPVLAGGVAYWMGARNLEGRERALARLRSRMEEVLVADWEGADVTEGAFAAASPPPWAPALLRAEGKGSFELTVRSIPQSYPNAFFGDGASRSYADLWRVTLRHRWPGGTLSLVTVKGGRP